MQIYNLESAISDGKTRELTLQNQVEKLEAERNNTESKLSIQLKIEKLKNRVCELENLVEDRNENISALEEKLWAERSGGENLNNELVNTRKALIVSQQSVAPAERTNEQL